MDGVYGSTHGFWGSFDGGETWKHTAGLNVDTQAPLDIYDTYFVAADPTDFNHILGSFHNTAYHGSWMYRGPLNGNHTTGIVESSDGGSITTRQPESLMAVGADVSDLKVGATVVIFPTLGSGKCRFCHGSLEHICPDKKVFGVNMGSWGALREFLLSNERQAVRRRVKVT